MGQQGKRLNLADPRTNVTGVGLDEQTIAVDRLRYKGVSCLTKLHIGRGPLRTYRHPKN